MRYKRRSFFSLLPQILFLAVTMSIYVIKSLENKMNVLIRSE